MNTLLQTFPIAHPAVQAFQNEDPRASKAFHKLTDEPHKVYEALAIFETVLATI
jgi:hypothetical protein